MTARAAITASAMREAVEAVKLGVRVTIKTGDTTVTLEPAQPSRDDGRDIDLVDMKR